MGGDAAVRLRDDEARVEDVRTERRRKSENQSERNERLDQGEAGG